MRANSITYHGKQLLEGPLNYFKLTCGTWPSFGFFRMRKVDVDDILDVKGGVAGDLVFTDGVIDKETREEWTVTLGGIYLVKSMTIDTLEQEICDVVLADARILWQYVYGAKDYNTYPVDRATGRAVNGERDFELENLNGDSEWTFDEIFTDLFTTLGLTEGAANDYLLDYPVITRKPRNVIGKNVTVPKALERLLADALCFLAVDLVKGTGSNWPFYDIYALGAAEVESEDLNVIANNTEYLHKELLTRLNPLTSRGDTAKMIVAASSGTKLTDAGSAAGIGGSGQKLLPSPYAIFGGEENTDFLKAVGDEVTDEYKQSFQNEWRDSIYAGIVDFRLCRAIHEITWQSNAEGAFTRIKSYRPRTDPPRGDTNFAYSDYWVGVGGKRKQCATVTATLNRGDITQGIEEVKLYKIRLEGVVTNAWATGQDYAVGDVVSVVEDDETTHYACTKAHTSNNDDKTYENQTFWEEVEGDLDAGVLHYEGDLLQAIPWFQVNDIVEVVHRPPEEEEEEGEPEWFILGTVTKTEEIIVTARHYSLLWNQSEKRAMAVFS